MMVKTVLLIVAYQWCHLICGGAMVMDIKNEQGFIKTSKADLWYEKYYTQASKEKIPLICIHGGPGVPHNYLLSLSQLAHESPIIFYDQSGCGKSNLHEPFEDWTFDHYANELAEFIAQLGYKKMYLLGHSWGCALAIDYAAKNQEKVKGLVLASPLFDTHQWVMDSKKHVEQLPQELRTTITECEATGNTDCAEYAEAVHYFYTKHVCRLTTWPSELQDSFGLLNMTIYKKMWGPSEFTATGNLATLNLRNHLKKLQMPVLITCGAYDSALPETMRLLVQELSQGELTVFNESSHTAHLEEPEKYMQVLRDFLYTQEIQESVSAWSEFLKNQNWEQLIVGKNPEQCGCGLVYELPNYLGRAQESFAIADMRNIAFSEPHYHSAEVTEIYFILQGAGIVVVGDTEYTVKAGDVIVTPPLTTHYVIPDKECVLAVVNIPAFRIEDYHVVTETNPAVKFDKEQLVRLVDKKGLI